MGLDKNLDALKLNDHDQTIFQKDKLEPEIEKLIKDIAVREGFLNYIIENKLISNVGGNYLGILYEVNIKDKNGQRELNLFVKKNIGGENIPFMSIAEAYSKEMFVYNELSKILEDLQTQAEIPTGDKFPIAKCYGVLKKCLSETLAMDNLSKKGYVTCDRMKSICLTFAELSVKDLAKFHALGYVLKLKRSDYFNNVLKKFGMPFDIGSEWVEFVGNVSKNSISMLDCKVAKSKVEYFIHNKMLKDMKSYYQPTNHSTLCHGDFRANNILVKLEDGQMKETMVVDYQLIYYGCPVNDFLYFIFGATDQEFREKHLENLKNLYFNTLRDFLKRFDIDVEDAYPRKEFDNDFRDRLDFGLMTAIQILPFILAVDEEVPDFADKNITDIEICINDNEMFKSRICEVVDDYMKWGYL